MRMRHKPYAQPELDACDFYVKNPVENLGHWYTAFETPAPLHLELGCGKGGFIAALAGQSPNINYIAIDLTPKVLIVAKRKIEAVYNQLARSVSNVKILTFDIARIAEMMNEADAVDRIYINFCN
ncbi:MAG: methyltransferase domain-containing protein, partial [Oscillospiraceae bacterium]|nr:methyltransferase domain-containing protein [Oscillospiraceae bacterium]